MFFCRLRGYCGVSRGGKDFFCIRQLKEITSAIGVYTVYDGSSSLLAIFNFRANFNISCGASFRMHRITVLYFGIDPVAIGVVFAYRQANGKLLTFTARRKREERLGCWSKVNVYT